MKKFWSSVFAAFLLTVLFTFGVRAETYGDLTYSISDGEVTITDCDTSATSVTIPETIDGYPVTSIGGFAFNGCKGLTSIAIPDSVTSIGKYAISYCTSLTSLTIPDSVKVIGESAFNNCTALKSVTLGNGVTSIGKNAFSDCYVLSYVYISDLDAWCRIDFDGGKATPLDYGTVLYVNGVEPTEVVLPDGMTAVKDYTFYYLKSLKSITIPDSVTSIGECAFWYCTSLSSVTLGNNVTNIGGYAFCGCENLSGITMPGSVTSIGEYAFSGCDGLTGITIGNGVTSIGERAFEGCTSLTGVTLGSNVTNIGNYAFYRCNSLTSIIIPRSVTSIGESTFSGCAGLTDITIPDSVTSIGYCAFEKCTSLTNVFYTGTKEEWEKINISGYNECLTNATIHYNYEPVDKVTLSGITLKNTSYKPISSIPAGDFIAEVTLTNNTYTAACTVLLTTYDADGRMLDMRYLYADPDTGKTITFGTGLSDPNGKIAKIKAFVLSDLRAFIILGEAAELTKA